MRAVAQRVSRASIEVGGERVGEMGPGLLALVGVARGDAAQDARKLADKLVHLRVFPDSEGKMNLSLLDTGGKLSLVSQFTLYADCRKGRRPSFIHALAPETAEPLYDRFVEICAARVPVSSSASVPRERRALERA